MSVDVDHVCEKERERKARGKSETQLIISRKEQKKEKHQGDG